MIATPELQAAPFRTPRGATVMMHARQHLSDGPVLETVLAGDEYRLGELRLEGWALDIGAHIGGATVALLADNPRLSVVALEPVPENVEILERNVRPWEGRCHVLRGIAGTQPIAYAFGGIALPEDYAAANRYVAGLERADSAERISADPWTLVKLLDWFGIDDVAFMKIDCEGGEWEFLEDAAANVRVALIRGEFHDDPGLGQGIVDVLSATHDVELWTTGKVVGLFEAVRR